MTKTVKADAVKFYTRRDSATTVLRKLGIQPRDYDLFIEKTSDGQFACQVARAEMHLESLKKPKTVLKEAVKAGRRAADPEVIKTRRVGVSSMARDLILAGKTNQEVWDVLKDAFNLDDSKKHYPTWYRCELKRKGLLPKEA